MSESMSTEAKTMVGVDGGSQGGWLFSGARSLWNTGQKSPHFMVPILLLGCLLFFLAAEVSAAEPQLEGEGVLGERNLSEQTLEVGGAVYSFGSASVIVGKSGEILSLGDLDVHDRDGEPALRPVLSGRFSATEVGSRFVIQRLELIESPR
ncbi:MAG: hypothetical protein VX252_09860 [Myxococcota bacterium]|nr:hypothetical protein [Myxococcota bacterium]